MIDKLLALKSLVTPQPSQPAHAELEHAHWDSGTRTWRPHHPQPIAQEDVADRRLGAEDRVVETASPILVRDCDCYAH
jgi:hypothetical protein